MNLAITFTGLHIYLHHVADPRIDRVLAALSTLTTQGVAMSEASKEMLTLVRAVGPAINTLEAKLTAAIKQLGTDSPETAQDIQDAMTELRTTLADAADGVDEADVPATSPPAA